MSTGSKVKKEAHILRSFLLPPKPEDFFCLIFAITYRCNSKCTMCNIWQIYRDNSEKFKEELSVKEIRGKFGESKLLKQFRSILIGGGEPFLKDDFVDIVLFFYELNPSLSIIIASNGQRPDFIKEKLEFITRTLVKRGIKDYKLVVAFSLDGIGDVHDRMRGIKGSYQRVMETVKLVKKVHGVYTGFPFTFTPGNYKEFLSVYELSKQLDVGCSFQFAQVSNHYYDNEEKQFKWNKEQLAEIREILIQTGHLAWIIGKPPSES
jgi:MoaA/NifB/PqqE/SkfB family radical SAM enzyme